MSAAAILIGIIMMLVGFYTYCDTFENSARYSTDQGVIRIILSVLAVSSGGMLSVFSYAGF